MKSVSKCEGKRFISLLTAIAVSASLLFALPANAAYGNTHRNTGDMRNDLIAVAKTQIGYCEGNTGSQLEGTIAGSGNYTKYGKWYGMSNAPWCAIFVSWCAGQAGIPSSVIPKHSGCKQGMDWFKNRGNWGWGKYWGSRQGKPAYTPTAGDLIYFGNGDLSKPSHVGIVYNVDSSYVYTIEGNISNQCAYRKYALNDAYIYGYGHPNYSIKEPTGPSDMGITGASYPTYLTEEQSFTVQGIISSKYKISWLQVGIYMPDGMQVISETVKPGTNTYNITSMNNKLKFGTLTAGEYIYSVEAMDTNGAYEELLYQHFTVKSAQDYLAAQLTGTPTNELALLPEAEELLISENYLLGLKFNVRVSELTAQFEHSAFVSVVDAEGIVLDEKAYVGTGCRVRLWDGETVKDELVVIVLGDTNGDGKLRSVDYLQIRRCFENRFDLEDVYFTAADVNENGKLDSGDYLKIRLAMRGEITI